MSWRSRPLVEMRPANAYDESYAKWCYEDLPITPDTWKYGVPKDRDTLHLRL
jgi:DNA topoisomerase-3